jgi:predicted ATPase/class 3 adenylate cyclase
VRTDTLTFLFTDIEGSTLLLLRLGEEQYAAALVEHHELIRSSLAGHGGTEVDTQGDGFFAVFSSARACVAAAVEMQRALEAHGWPDGERIRVRMGIHSGEAAQTATGLVGLDIHRAARVGAVAHGGQILLSETAAALVRDRVPTGAMLRELGPHTLKDFDRPERLFQLEAAGLPAEFPPPRTPPVRLTNLRPRTRELIGRERELGELRALLLGDAEVVVTVSGVGGIGKSRLAIAAGYELLAEFPGGVFLVRLAGISDSVSLLPMIAEVLGVTGASDERLMEILARRLSEPPTLVVLDNFEQLVAAAPMLSQLLEHGEGVRLLVTSQLPLRIAAERVMVLGPLADADAANLFIERSSAIVPDFSPTGGDLDAIAEVCTRVDCMPLAIELAAARVGSLGPQQLAERLERPLGLLTRGERDAPARQRSLRAAIEWTYALLNERQRSLLARLGVCAGAVPLSAVEAISPDGNGAELLDEIDALLEFSFVRRTKDPLLGIRLLVPQALRDFALEKLVESGLEDETRRSHAEHIASIAHSARLGRWGASHEQRAALAAVADEIRPAVAWAGEHNPELHVRLAAALSFSVHGLYGGVLSELTDGLQQARDSGAGTPAERAKLVTALAKIYQLADDGSRSKEFADQALVEWEAVDDTVERAIGRQDLSWVLRWETRYQDAIALAEDALPVMRDTGERRLILRGLVVLAHAYVDTEDVDRTEAVLEEAEPLAAGDPGWDLAEVRGDCEWFKGNDIAALAWYTESLTWASTVGESHSILMGMRSIIPVLAHLGFSEEALEVFELTRLEAERTGRRGDIPKSFGWLQKAVSVAKAQVGNPAAQTVAQRAREVANTDRAARVIEITHRAVASAKPAN